MVATPALPLAHVPPVTASVKADITPAHTAEPLIGDTGLTVTVAVAIHPAGAV